LAVEQRDLTAGLQPQHLDMAGGGCRQIQAEPGRQLLIDKKPCHAQKV
jgi:hypothetical protein